MSAHIWHGTSPSMVTDDNSYEMASVIVALRPVTLTGIRVTGNPAATANANRRARLWSMDKVVQDSIALPATLPSGPVEVPLTTPRSLHPGDLFMVSYDTAGAFASVSGAFAAGSYMSEDGAMAFASPPNGRFSPIGAGTWPEPSFGNSWYGADVVYDYDPDAVITPPPAGDLLPTSPLVAAAWLKTIAGLYAGVATTLPQDVTGWAEQGFVVVSTVGGQGSIDVPMRASVVSVDCWAAAPNSGRAPVGKASSLAEVIRAATYAHFPVSVQPGPGDYRRALVHSAYLVQDEPRRILDPDGSRAHITFDLAIMWTVEE